MSERQMQMKEVKALVLQYLYKMYQERGPDTLVVIRDLPGQIPAAPQAVVRTALNDLYRAGLVAFQGMGAKLSVIGIEQAEDPSTETGSLILHAVTVTGGHVQIGNNNTQNIKRQPETRMAGPDDGRLE